MKGEREEKKGGRKEGREKGEREERREGRERGRMERGRKRKEEGGKEGRGCFLCCCSPVAGKSSVSGV